MKKPKWRSGRKVETPLGPGTIRGVQHSMVCGKHHRIHVAVDLNNGGTVPGLPDVFSHTEIQIKKGS